MGDTILKMTDIDKSFPGVKALSACQFDLDAGEVHALIGENGAGKSTIMKILTGVYTKDSGKIVYMGKEINLTGPKMAQDLGICIIHQELNLMPHLTVAQNMYIGREKANSFFITDKEINEGAGEIFKSMNLDMDPKTKVADLTVAKQQMVEIAKALTFDSKILVMDEPTAALTESEIEELFHIISDLKARGVGIVYISHRMEELFKISDRVTVMRDGEYVGTKITSETNLDEIIKMMVGRTIYHEPRSAESPHIKDEVVLEVKNASRGRAVKDASFCLKRGEILGFAGLMGAGRTELARLVFGADPMDSGEVYLNGERVNIPTPAHAAQHGIGYLSEDRKRYGLTLGESVEDNIALASYDKYTKFGFIDYKSTRADSEKYIDILRIKTPSPQQLTKYLSGGNQQKVVIAKWLLKNCDILIFDEPTRGIDVGAKSEIYDLLDELVKEGKSIIMISSELPEILRMSDRVVVMCEGRITGELDAMEATQESIMALATKRDAGMDLKQKEMGLN